MKKQSQTHGRPLTAFESFLLHSDQVIPRAEDQVWLADWKNFKLPYCSIYVVCPDGQWPCKVGISTYAYKRLLALQTSVWKPLKMMRCYWAKTVAEARALEKAVHRRLTEDNVWLHGEWFDMRPNSAQEIIEFVALVEGIEIFSEIDNQEVISDIATTIRQSVSNDFHIDRINHGSHKTFDGEALADLAKSYIENGDMVPRDLAKEVMLHKEHEESMRLPSLKAPRNR